MNETTFYGCNTYKKEYCKLKSDSPLNATCLSNSTNFMLFPMIISLPGEICDPK